MICVHQEEADCFAEEVTGQSLSFAAILNEKRMKSEWASEQEKGERDSQKHVSDPLLSLLFLYENSVGLRTYHSGANWRWSGDFNDNPDV